MPGSNDDIMHVAKGLWQSLLSDKNSRGLR